MIRKIRSNMALSIIGVIILSLIVFAILITVIGYAGFSRSLKKEYSQTTYYIANTAAALINADIIDDFLTDDEWYLEMHDLTSEALQEFCEQIHVSMIYVIKVDTSDYGRFVSVLNVVDNSVDDSEYIPWELGYERDTTNDEYREKYRKIYEKESDYETVFRMNPTDGQHPHITAMVPVIGSDGEVKAILCVQRPVSELTRIILPFTILIGLATLGLAIFTAAFISRFFRKKVIVPVRKVAGEASRFAKDNTLGEPLGNISRYTELSELAGSIDTMETRMMDYIDNLTAATAERERISTELSLATKIQENAVPNQFPVYTDREEFEVYGSMTPAKEVGGDFYNFFLIDEDHLVTVIGDVSGKGIPGALFMMVSNIIIKGRSRLKGTPSQILNFVNESLCENNKACMFVTVWLGILEISTGKITAANAGHEDAAVYRKNGNFELFTTKHLIPAGVMPEIKYRDFEIQLEKGDKIFLYTDGVPEAREANGEMYTLERMIRTLNILKESSPMEILEGVKKDVDEFVGDEPQFDDLTMLGLEYRGK